MDIHLRVHVAKEGWKIIMKDDFISRQAAITALEQTKEKDPKGDIAFFYNKITDNKIAVIAAQPSVDAVEVVRCKDCKWHNEEINQICASMYDKDFCSKGERRTDE